MDTALRASDLSVGRLLVALGGLLFIASPALAMGQGLFSAQGVSIGKSIRWNGPPDRSMSGRLVVGSPDAHSGLTVTYREWGDELKHSFHSALAVRLSGRAGPSGFDRRYEAIGDVLWSPDSRHVAVSLSGGGLGGVYDLFVLGRGGKVRDLSATFRRRLDPPARCDLGRFANVAAITWLSARRLLVMARQLWEDSCPEKNRAMFYEYDIASGRIGPSYSLPEAKRRFPSRLGSLAR
jgi:hypothetical protein